MRILITGGAGFIGSHLAKALCDRGDEVAVLDDLSNGRRDKVPAPARFYHVDLRDREAVFGAVADFRPEAVSHHAAQVSVASSVREPLRDAQINLIGSLNLLDACCSSGAQVQRVVFASTGGAIYGEVAEGEKASETSPPAPLSPYAIHKLAVEQLLSVYRLQRGLSSTVLRYANVYGPGQDANGEAGVVAIFLAQIQAGRSIRINARRELGDAGCVRDYVFVGDVVLSNLLALAGRIDEGTINVATGRETTTQELATRLLDASGSDSTLEFGPSRLGDLQRSVLDPSKLQQYLGQFVALEDGLEQTRQAFAKPSSS